MKVSKLVLVAAMLAAAPAWAGDLAGPQTTFMKTFANLCVRRLGNLEALRAELKSKKFPVLQEPAASRFLGGRPGDAWPLPDSGVMGNLVLTLPTDHYECSVYARQGDGKQAELWFSGLVAQAPKPFISELYVDKRVPQPAGGELHTLGYLWKLTNSSRAFVYFLTTSNSPNAQVQLKATASRVQAP